MQERKKIMICKACFKKISDGSNSCPYCNTKVTNNTKNSGNGLAKLEVRCRKHLPIWMLVFQPVSYFVSYKVHISIDEKDYVLVSKNEKVEIPVAPGTHLIRIASVSKKGSKAMQGVGKFAAFAGAVTGSGATYVAGAALDDFGDAFLSTGAKIDFVEGETVTIKVKLNYMGIIVEDK